MTAPPPPPPPKAPFSLYDNLLDPKDPNPPATISSATSINNRTILAEEKRPLDSALRFQPIRRPTAKQAKPKPMLSKATSSSKSPIAADAATNPTSSSVSYSSLPPLSKSSLADWTATEEDEWKYGVGEKRQRGGRKRKKKKQNMHIETDWDEIYDPTRPTNIEEYMRSDEKIEEVREWKSLLYRHRNWRDESVVSSDEDEADKKGSAPPNQFAPPPLYSFAPPPASPPTAPLPDEGADEVYARRMALSSDQLPPPAPPSPHSLSNFPPPPPPTSSDSAIISRAPVRYAQPIKCPLPELPEEEVEGCSSPPNTSENNHQPEENSQLRTNRPGQSGFAQRLMGKYGWTKGSGLGANESGIVNPLRVQVEKRRKKADADGGGWAEPAGKGKIIASKRKEESGKFGKMSDVIVLRNMLENMPNLQAEIADGLGQEIGEECGEKYGRVERLYIDQASRLVFIKFTNQVSALRAVNELDGRNFNGNNISPGFYDSELFDQGLYNAT